jgi:HTH-type transcriptional regulator, sugar sensing transcriptional regulator
MKSNLIKNCCSQLNIPDFESELYLLLIKQKEINITKLADVLGVQRKRVYQSLELLEKAGMVNRTAEEIEVELPLTLLDKLREKEDQTKKLAEDLNEYLPELDKLIHFLPNQTLVKTYEGRYQFLRLFEEILREAHGEISHFGSNDAIVEILGNVQADNWVKRRVGRTISTKELIFQSDFLEQRRNIDTKELREIKHLPKKMEVSASYLIYGSKVAIWNSVLPRVVVIDDKIIKNLMLNNFDLIWGLLE